MSTLVPSPSRVIRILVLLCALAGIWFWNAGSGSSVASSDPSPQVVVSAGPQFPLWNAVPVKAFAVLGTGTVQHMEWGAYVYRRLGEGAGQEPCVVVASFYFGAPARDGGGLFNPGVGACGAVAPPASEVVAASAGIVVRRKLGGKRIASKAIALTLSPDVRSVRLQLRPGPSRTLPTRLLSTQQASKAHVRQFSYVAFGLARRACVARVTGYDVSGAQIFDGSSRGC